MHRWSASGWIRRLWARRRPRRGVRLAWSSRRWRPPRGRSPWRPPRRTAPARVPGIGRVLAWDRSIRWLRPPRRRPPGGSILPTRVPVPAEAPRHRGSGRRGRREARRARGTTASPLSPRRRSLVDRPHRFRGRRPRLQHWTRPPRDERRAMTKQHVARDAPVTRRGRAAARWTPPT